MHLESSENPDSIHYLQSTIGQRIDELAFQTGDFRQRFLQAQPIPHLVIDNFMPTNVADMLESDFPAPNHASWVRLPTEDQRFKLATNDESKIPALQRYVLFMLNSGQFLRLLESVTGINGLIADTKLVGGGMHQILPGGKLSVHIDYSHHPQNGLFRRLNLLLYLNKGWKSEWRGELELWDQKITAPQVKIEPIFNRAVIFVTSEISFHGHPEPLACPDGVTRKSLSLYYFTKDPPEGKEDVVHNTLFKSRSGDAFNLRNSLVRAASSGFARDLVPPIIYKAIRSAWNRKFTGK